MIDAAEAMRRLRDGNDRFVSGESTQQPVAYSERDVPDPQQPFAIVIACSDSRVPVEMLFDQGVGELFVIRVAGNVVAASQRGSIEYAVDVLGARLIVVLGHSRCGAVGQALEDVINDHGGRGENLGFLLDRIQPAMAELVANNRGQDIEALTEKAIRVNVRASIQALEASSSRLRKYIDSGDLEIRGAEYSLETGEVEFLAA